MLYLLSIQKFVSSAEEVCSTLDKYANKQEVVSGNEDNDYHAHREGRRPRDSVDVSSGILPDAARYLVDGDRKFESG